MSTQLTKSYVKMLCGRISYDRGEAYYRSGKVHFTRLNHDSREYEATVTGSDHYHVHVQFDAKNDVDAVCDCPAFTSYNKSCKHIAAVLLGIVDRQNGNAAPSGRSVSLLYPENNPASDSSEIHISQREQSLLEIASSRQNEVSSRDLWLTRDMMSLFGDPRYKQPSRIGSHFDSRTPLEVEFILSTVPYGYKKYLFAVEMKVGTKRVYIVKNIRQFLECVERRQSYAFTNQFSYDPELHCFSGPSDDIIQQLIDISLNEQMYQESFNKTNFLHSRKANNERYLHIPPYAWNRMQPLLSQDPAVRVDIGPNHKILYDFHLSHQPLPIQFSFEESDDGVIQFHVQGLEEITIMDSYGIIIAEHKLILLSESQCHQLYELQKMLDASQRRHIQVAAEQIEPFMEKVLPGLKKLGNVNISDDIAKRMVQTKLKARLYLDRVKDRLVAGLEFQYGNIVINPLEQSGSTRGSELILLRDVEQEGLILGLMDEGGFVQTESGYFLDDEDTEYEFLYHIVPGLEELLDIYATSAVKIRIAKLSVPPKITVDVNERTNWLEIKFDLDGISQNEIRGLIQSLTVKRKYHRLPNGALLPLDSSEFQQIVTFMNEVGQYRMDDTGTGFRIPLTSSLHLLDDHRQGNAIQLSKSLRKLLQNMKNPDNLDFPVPESLSGIMRDYQVYGFQWMKTLAHYRFGGILADDMGLGKTLQSISFLVSVLPEIREQQMPAIIVAPASLVYNWRNELKKFAPDIVAIIADGSKADRVRTIKDQSGVDVIITSYPLLRRDIEQYTNYSFHTLFLDEAQMFKNHTTQTAHAVKAIEAKYSFALTGTPIENSLDELWSIFDVVFPALFGDQKSFNELTREQIAKRISPFLLRRVKTDVLRELPEKIESLQSSELFPEQKKLYAAFLAQLQEETLKHLSEDGFQKHRIRILAGLTRLRQLCCHPALFVENYKGSSAKFEQLLELVEECRSSGKRMLIFSQFTGMLDIIGRELAYRDFSYFYLDGSTPSAERVELCNRFNEGERELFLISLKAGGTGLNLTGADTVILYDLWWNPAVEQQAADRAHRIGQKNSVHVIRLVSEGTVEDKMYELQQKKRDLIDEVLQPGQKSVSSLSEEEIRDILMI
ncbi:superfamily II DNA or RNA helicase [Fontibacillus solani]|uniref:Superfamily II DNA or RNA helicase n=1 Tax=Fontibacillus solani TaxID=1572857 RepID=A0A7W3SSU8_9BACL|nr:DEAD/DEAH box helicase [Fontibacillus solani]MBA9085647.1 superfamily II DNA or RNA helicase [Fontibacillus solani]